MSHKVEYRVVRSESTDNKYWYSIQEVYLDDNSEPYAQTVDLQVEGGQIDELIFQLENMKEAINKPIMNEIKFKHVKEIDSATNSKGDNYSKVELEELQQELDINIKKR